jgi:hypothetical protein
MTVVVAEPILALPGTLGHVLKPKRVIVCWGKASCILVSVRRATDTVMEVFFVVR